MLLKYSMKVVYVNYQRLGRAGKQTQKILFKKEIIVKILG